MEQMMHLLDLIGTATFAITGALAARGKHMDIFGVIVLSCVTAVGGGTLRDIILADQPVFWLTHPEYLGIAVTTAVATFLLVQYWQLPAKALMYADAVGLAVFTIIGFRRGFEATQSYSIAIVMGMTTGVVGGMIRDLLTGEIPLILRREIYASASLAGAALLALLLFLQLPASVAALLSLLTTLSIRLVAVRRNLSLPVFWLAADNNSQTKN